MADVLELTRRVLELERAEGATTGTFTPSWRGLGTGGTFTYSAQSGWYTRVGNLVFFQLRITITAISVAPTGAMVIDGLPVAAASGRTGGVTIVFQSQVNLTAGSLALAGRIDGAEQSIRWTEIVDNAAAIAYAGGTFTNAAADLALIGFYFV